MEPMRKCNTRATKQVNKGESDRQRNAKEGSERRRTRVDDKCAQCASRLRQVRKKECLKGCDTATSSRKSEAQ